MRSSHYSSKPVARGEDLWQVGLKFLYYSNKETVTKQSLTEVRRGFVQCKLTKDSPRSRAMKKLCCVIFDIFKNLDNSLEKLTKLNLSPTLVNYVG